MRKLPSKSLVEFVRVVDEVAERVVERVAEKVDPVARRVVKREDFSILLVFSRLRQVICKSITSARANKESSA
jgi:hypothetical protein